MLKIYTILSLILTVSVSTAFAQNKINGSVKGKLADTLRKESLANATVSVVNPKDSSVVSYTVANAKGEFEIKDLDGGLYKIIVSFQGYAPFSKNFMISAQFPSVNLNTIHMERQGTTLQEVVVEGPPIQVKNDTVEFRASAFKVKPNANAEDIMKKLPGVQVDKDGNVKAQGEDVQKVLVDGKEFFGTDPKLATKNITADMIESIQVFDDMSDQAKFTKMDDGSRQKTINIKLKKDKRKGYFGRVVAGYGTEERYEGNLSLNKFNGEERVSIIANSNNINKSTFNFSDIISSMGGFGTRGATGGGGGGGGGGRGSFGGAPSNFGTGRQGITQATTAGINYSNKFNNKLNVTGSYFFSDSRVENEQSSVRQTFFPGDSVSIQNQLYNSFNRNQNHRVNLRFEWAIDSMNTILYTPRIVLQHSESESFDTTFTRATKPGIDYLAIAGATQNNNERDGLNVNQELLFRHKFRKTGRTFTVGINNSISNSDGKGTNHAPMVFFNPDSTVSRIRSQDLRTELITRSFNNTISASYTEPLSFNKLLEFNYAYTDNHSTSDRKAWDYDVNTGKYDSVNALQTNYFENDFTAHRYGINFRVQQKKYSFQLGGGLQQSQLTSKSFRESTGKDSTFTQRVLNFFPNANFQYMFSKSKNLRIRYNGRTNQPSVTQLQNVPDLTNPLQVIVGNPSLKPEFTNNFNANYSTFNAATFKFLNANMNFSQTYNKIVNTIDTIGKGTQLLSYANMNGAWNANAFITLGFPLKGKLKGSNFNFNTNVNYRRDASMLYKQENYNGNLSVTQTAGINFDFKQKLNLGFNGSLTYNDVRYSVQTNGNLNEKYFTQTYSADVSYMGLKNFVFITDFDYFINTGRSDGFNAYIPLWNASMAYQLFKKKNGEIKLSVNDILNQNESVTRNVGDNYIEDVRSLVLKRYFLLTFTYNLSKGAQQPQRGNMPQVPRQMERQFQRMVN